MGEANYLAQETARFLTIPALMLKRSLLVMPGFRGAPAGMTTMSHPLRASNRLSSPEYPLTSTGVGMCDKSVAIPILHISYKESLEMLDGVPFKSKERG